MITFHQSFEPNISKLALGTVQFGLPYGISSAAEKVSRDEVAAILALASSAGINTLDTAIAYGESEAVLGGVGTADWKLVSKLPALPENITNVSEWVVRQLNASLQRLGTSSLYGLLLHRPNQLNGQHGDAIEAALLDLKRARLVRKVGVSIYEPIELQALIKRRCIDLVQAPLSILDRSIVVSGWARQLKESGIELHVRSVFLQGLLLMGQQRPLKFARWKSLWNEWDNWLADNALTPLQACLGYALSVPEVDRVVVGVECREQLQAIISAAKHRPPAVPEWHINDAQILLNPANWNQL